MSTSAAQIAEFDADEIEAGRLLFARESTFLRGVVALDGLPDASRIEVAFAGRSNVGKSSLLNTLTGRKALARTSNTPGRTQEINYFTLGDDYYLVDMPGYGYAKVERRRVEAWTQLIRDYLRGRASLRRLFLLIDARHGLKPTDIEIMELMDEAAVSFQVVLTKCDKPKPDQLDRVIAQTAKALAKHPAAHPVLHVTSSVKLAGIDMLRAEISALAAG
ncbi:MAG: ribosome biogenesis GTP-binding protein YihA/YsxC [Hyphomicrobiales bacterium]